LQEKELKEPFTILVQDHIDYENCIDHTIPKYDSNIQLNDDELVPVKGLYKDASARVKITQSQHSLDNYVPGKFINIVLASNKYLAYACVALAMTRIPTCIIIFENGNEENVKSFYNEMNTKIELAYDSVKPFIYIFSAKNVSPQAAVHQVASWLVHKADKHVLNLRVNPDTNE